MALRNTAPPARSKASGKFPKFPAIFLAGFCFIVTIWLLSRYWHPVGRGSKGRASVTHESGGKKEKFNARKELKEAADETGKKIKEIFQTADDAGKAGQTASGRWDYLNNIPGFGYPESKEKGNQVVRHTAYTLCYSNVFEQAIWVAYKLSDEDLKGKARRKGEEFHADPAVKLGSAIPQDYAHSGYDRGHLAPAGDMIRSPDAMSESFYMSNMSPQVPAFNRGIWKELEEQVRHWAKRDKNLYVVTGPLIDKLNHKFIGINSENKVAIPEAYYKVLLDLREPDIKMIAFVIPNKGSAENPDYFAVTVDEAERQSGLDFFSQMPDSLESVLEGRLEAAKWFKGYSAHRKKKKKGSENE
ncbi:MAG: DNA/RNA non-specific endonuclease [Bacteroidota bacterium]